MKKWEVADEFVTIMSRDREGFVPMQIQVPQDLSEGQERNIFSPMGEFLVMFKKRKGVVYYSRTLGVTTG